MADQRVLIVVNGKGVERELSERSWRLLRSAKEQGNTRKGYTFVRWKAEGEKGVGGPPSKVAVMGPAGPTFVPPEVAAAASAAAEEATRNSGTHVTAEEVLAASGASNAAPAPAPEAPPPAPPVPVVETPAAEQPKAVAAAAPVTSPVIPGDDLTKIKNVGPNTAKALNGAGVLTYKDLVDMDTAKLEAALDAAGYTAKKPLVKNWKAEAAAIIAAQNPT